MGEYANGAGQPLLQFSTVSLHRQMRPYASGGGVCQGAAGGVFRRFSSNFQVGATGILDIAMYRTRFPGHTFVLCRLA